MSREKRDLEGKGYRGDRDVAELDPRNGGCNTPPVKLTSPQSRQILRRASHGRTEPRSALAVNALMAQSRVQTQRYLFGVGMADEPTRLSPKEVEIVYEVG